MEFLSLLSVVVQPVLSLSLSEALLLALVAMLSYLASKASSASCAFSRLAEAVEHCGAKLSYIELRMDKAQSRVAGSLRHLVAKVSEYDSEIGAFHVLRSWISAERDSWLMRRSAESWRLLSATAQYSILNEAICLRITSGGPETESTVMRHMSNLRALAKKMPKTKWAELGSDAEPMTQEQVLKVPEETMAELYAEVVEHRNYLKLLCAECKKSWAEIAFGLSVQDIYSAEARSSEHRF